MKVLIVDDQNDKVIAISEVLVEAGVESGDITVSTTGSGTLELLKNQSFELMILDLYLPDRIGEKPSIDGGVRLLRRLRRGGDLNLPESIFGLTGSSEARNSAESEFRDQGWALEELSPASAAWKVRLLEKVQYIRARSLQSFDKADQTASVDESPVDVLLVCALVEPELSELQAASGTPWIVETFVGDPTIYWSTTLMIKQKPAKVLAISLPQMGLVASAAAVAKCVATVKPRMVVMTGICAGRKGDCELGDVIGASITWDYGSGKFVKSGSEIVFEAAPFQAPTPARVIGALTRLSLDNDLMRDLYSQSPGSRPAKVPRFHVGPMASGAAVQNQPEFFDGVARQQRKILGVDMEAFGVAWACHEASEPQPCWMIIKTVVDFADGSKNSDLQKFGSFISAKFALYAISEGMV